MKAERRLAQSLLSLKQADASDGVKLESSECAC